MSTLAISVEKLSKAYQLGTIGTGTFRGDLQRWWAKTRGRPDPYLKVGEAGQKNSQGDIIWALKDLCFTVEAGEALGIIGRNGAGKSTLLKILSRVTAPTTGIIKIKGRIASLLEVGTGFHPELTGRENVYLNGAIMGMNNTEIRQKFDEIVDFSGVAKFIDTPVKRYSSGMYVRLAFAVAAHLEPDILVVDEALAVGDAEFQKKCLGKMDDVAQDGRTVIFVSHSLSAIKTLCSRAILIDAGSIIADGEVYDVIDTYLLKKDAGSSGVATIQDNYPRQGKGPARIIKVELVDHDDQPQISFFYGQPFRIRLTINLAEPIQEEILAFLYLTTPDGTRFGTTYNIEHNNPAWRLAPGHSVVTIDINAALLPHQTYNIDIGLYNKPGTVVFDFVEQVLQFDVNPKSEDGRENYPGSYSHAYIKLPSQWRQPEHLNQSYSNPIQRKNG